MIFLNFSFKIYYIILSLAFVLSTNMALAGSNGILVVDLDRAYQSSKFGKSIRKNFGLENQSFNEENDAILESLKQEEIKLTEERQNLSPEEFSKAAEAFDKKAVAIRAVRLEKIRLVDKKFQELKPLFYNQIRPIIEKIMREYDASIILEKNTVIWSLASIDITSLIVERVDQAFMNAKGSQASELEN